MDRGACPALVGGVTSVGHDLASKPPPPPHITIIYYICFMFNLILLKHTVLSTTLMMEVLVIKGDYF